MDLEMTFADQDVIMKLTEDLMRTVFKEVIFLVSINVSLLSATAATHQASMWLARIQSMH